MSSAKPISQKRPFAASARGGEPDKRDSAIDIAPEPRAKTAGNGVERA